MNQIPHNSVGDTIASVDYFGNETLDISKFDTPGNQLDTAKVFNNTIPKEPPPLPEVSTTTPPNPETAEKASTTAGKIINPSPEKKETSPAAKESSPSKRELDAIERVTTQLEARVEKHKTRGLRAVLSQAATLVLIGKPRKALRLLKAAWRSHQALEKNGFIMIINSKGKKEKLTGDKKRVEEFMGNIRTFPGAARRAA